MKLIKLFPYRKRKFAKVDDADYDYLIQFKWHLKATKHKGRFYTRRFLYDEDGDIVKTFSMHRELLSVDDPKILVDHRNGDGLDCQRSNIRIATRSQNNANKRISKNKKDSKYLGVHKIINKKSIKWLAECRKDGKAYREKCENENDAALAYNKFAIKLHGEFANLNIVN